MNAENPTQLEKPIKYKHMYRVYRGGSWSGSVGYSRASFRYSFDRPPFRRNHLGFRLVRNK
jgi:formylglycine-generating enzyme required for sulfatase activity